MSPVVVTVLTLAVTAAAIGTPQVPHLWRTSDARGRLLWMGAVFYNATVIVGAYETLRRGLPPGVRWYVALLPTVWLLVAVLHAPVTALLGRRRG